LIATIVARQK
jgi:hypothetical protein